MGGVLGVRSTQVNKTGELNSRQVEVGTGFEVEVSRGLKDWLAREGVVPSRTNTKTNLEDTAKIADNGCPAAPQASKRLLKSFSAWKTSSSWTSSGLRITRTQACTSPSLELPGGASRPGSPLPCTIRSTAVRAPQQGLGPSECPETGRCQTCTSGQWENQLGERS